LTRLKDNIKTSVIEKIAYKVTKNYLYLLLFLLLIGLIFLLTLPYPKHPDMFFYIEGAKVIKSGGLIYKDFGDLKPPLIFFIYSLTLAIFNESNIFLGLKLVGFLFEITTAFLIFLLSQRIFKNKTVPLSLSIITLILINTGVTTWYPNIFLFYIPFLLLSLIFLIKDNFNFSNLNLFISGLFLGICFITSTNLIFYSLLYPILLFYRYKNIKKIILKTVTPFIGFIIPIFIVIIYYYSNNALDDFIWWNIKWQGKYGNYYTLWLRIWKFFYSFIITWYFLPVYLLGIYSIIKIIKNKDINLNTLFLLSIFFISLVVRFSLCKGVERYMLFILPVMVIILPYGFYCLKPYTKKIYLLVSIIIVAIGFTINQIEVFKESESWELSIEKNREVIEYIKKNSKKDDKIFVFNRGGFEFIYFYSERKNATSFILAGQHLDFPYL